MAFLHSTRAIRAAFLQLPPQIRTAAFAQTTPCVRPFTSTPRRNVDPVSALTSGPTFVMDALHNMGLPWWGIIPCTALLFRGVLTYYLFTRPRHRLSQKRAAVTPLVEAYKTLQRDSKAEQGIQRTWGRRSAPEILFYTMVQNGRLRLRGNRKLGRLTGLGWKSGGSMLGNFGILVTVTEAIRQKCGRGEGLLSMLLSPVTEVQAANKGFDNVAYEQTMRILQQAASDPGAAAMASGTGVTSTMASASNQQIPDGLLAMDPTLSPTYDPALQTEGLSWFPDLTIADPYTLPFILALTIYIPFTLRPHQPIRDNRHSHSEKPSISQEPSKREDPYSSAFQAYVTRLKKVGVSDIVMLVVAAYFYMVATSMPAGLVLYWISSFGIGSVQRVWMDIRYPPARPIAPCNRPVRARTDRMWDD